jgi:hypothetical protein
MDPNLQATFEMLKVAIAAATALAAVGTLVRGVVELRHANGIRRYEKFHEMSKRFDSTPEIQAVCELLRGTGSAADAVTVQKKEMFICFLEEILFMMESGTMKPEIALYTFGYYGKAAIDNDSFWRGLNRSEPFYRRFLDFCKKAKEYEPPIHAPEKALRF